MSRTDSISASIAEQKIIYLEKLLAANSNTLHLLTRTIEDTHRRLAKVEATQSDAVNANIIAIVAAGISIFAIVFSIYQYKQQGKKDTLFHLIKEITDANTTFRNALVDVKNGNWTTTQAKEYRSVLAMDILLKADQACKFYLNDKVDKEKFDFHLKVDIVASYTQLSQFSEGKYPNLVQYYRTVINPNH